MLITYICHFYSFFPVFLLNFVFASIFNDTNINLTIDNFNTQNHFILVKYNISNDNRILLNHWIEQELQVSNHRILLNIRTDQSFNNQYNFDPFQKDINPGVSIASNSRSHPNYFFQWIRDSSITSLYLSSFGLSTQNVSLYNQLLLEYINNSKSLQRVNNKSGNFSSISNWSNLGEPKFYCNNTSFDLQWGRPQNDGPALRLIAILTYLATLDLQQVAAIDSALKRSILDEVCQFDMRFVLKNWNLPSFDPWEEVYSFHFFNNMVHLYSLRLYQSLVPNDPISKSINGTIQHLEDFIEKRYIDLEQELIIETPAIWHMRQSQVDIAVIIASLITHPLDPLQLDIQIPFDVDDLLVLNVLYRLIQDMKLLYPINWNKNISGAVALGRYPEDIYDGIDVSEGNPWFLATCQGANILYRLIKSSIDKKNDLNVTLKENNFWNLFFQSTYSSSTNNNNNNNYPLINNITLTYKSDAFNETLKQIFNFADGFLQIVQMHVNSHGEMSEQFNKYTGYLTGAANLTWSYVEFVNAVRARNAILYYFI